MAARNCRDLASGASAAATNCPRVVLPLLIATGEDVLRERRTAVSVTVHLEKNALRRRETGLRSRVRRREAPSRWRPARSRCRGSRTCAGGRGVWVGASPRRARGLAPRTRLRLRKPCSPPSNPPVARPRWRAPATIVPSIQRPVSRGRGQVVSGAELRSDRNPRPPFRARAGQHATLPLAPHPLFLWNNPAQWALETLERSTRPWVPSPPKKPQTPVDDVEIARKELRRAGPLQRCRVREQPRTRRAYRAADCRWAGAGVVG